MYVNFVVSYSISFCNIAELRKKHLSLFLRTDKSVEGKKKRSNALSRHAAQRTGYDKIAANSIIENGGIN